MLEELRLESERARRTARSSLSAYGSFVFGLDPSAHQDLWCEVLEAVESGAIRRLVIIAPPGHAKSTYGSIEYPSWYLGRHPTHRLMIASTSDELANLYGDAVRETIERNERYREVFPEAVPDKARGWSRAGAFLVPPPADRYGLVEPSEKDPNLSYIGSGGGAVGRRLHGIVLDDPIDEAVARSETMLEARKLWVRRTLSSRLRPRVGWIVVIGTVWVEGDVVDELASSGRYVVVRMAAWGERVVVADVTIPDDVAWRPARYYQQLEEEATDGRGDRYPIA